MHVDALTESLQLRLIEDTENFFQKRSCCWGTSSFIIDDERKCWHLYAGNTAEFPLISPKLRSSRISQVACGYNHVSFLSYEGYVWWYGTDDFDDGFFDPPSLCIIKDMPLITGISSCCDTFCIAEDSTLWCYERKKNKSLRVQNLENVQQVICGASHSFVICEDGSILAKGPNLVCQLGVSGRLDEFTKVTLLHNENELEVTSIACGIFHTLFLTSNGNVYGCGSNEYHQLGDIDASSALIQLPVHNISQIACGKTFSLFLDHNNVLWKLGPQNKKSASSGIPSKINIKGRVTGISGSYNDYCLLLNEEGNLWRLDFSAYQKIGSTDKHQIKGIRFKVILDEIPEFRNFKDQVSWNRSCYVSYMFITHSN